MRNPSLSILLGEGAILKFENNKWMTYDDVNSEYIVYKKDYYKSPKVICRTTNIDEALLKLFGYVIMYDSIRNIKF